MNAKKAKTKAPSDEEPTFEVALARLEELVETLEEGEVPLEESVRAYAEGMELVRQCAIKLRAAEETLQRLQESEEGFLLTDEETVDDGE